ncbi:hypothetical protein [Vallitalea guaymasensis]|uniref:hypothetical protein n=1 Tax=Vallitalea guaymasensis TaxID=1185412 RepID=UPI000DE4D25C|nr:hypothetical protein [Vallitalea guaymasensis]
MYYEFLNDKELLGLVLKESKESITDDLFREFENLPNLLFNSTAEELVQIKGIGQKKAQQLLAIKEIIKRLNAYTWVKNKYKRRNYWN